GIRAVGGGFQHVVLDQREIFAQHREFYRFARLFQIFQTALEERAIGENRESGGAASFVLNGRTAGIEIRGEESPAGRGFLDFSDDGRRLAPQIRGETAAFPALLRGQKFPLSRRAPLPGKLLALARNNTG